MWPGLIPGRSAVSVRRHHLQTPVDLCAYQHCNGLYQSLFDKQLCLSGRSFSTAVRLFHVCPSHVGQTRAPCSSWTHWDAGVSPGDGLLPDRPLLWCECHSSCICTQRQQPVGDTMHCKVVWPKALLCYFNNLFSHFILIILGKLQVLNHHISLAAVQLQHVCQWGAPTWVCAPC